MGDKVYILLDVAQGRSAELARAIRNKPGVVMADTLEGPPDVVVVLESSERMKLANLMMQVLESVQTLVEGIHLLPVRDELNTRPMSPTLGRRKRK